MFSPGKTRAAAVEAEATRSRTGLDDFTNQPVKIPATLKLANYETQQNCFAARSGTDRDANHHRLPLQL